MLKGGKLLLGRRGGGHGRGTWSMPGGKIEFGESFEEAAKREVLEETGIILRAARIICVNSDRSETRHSITVGLVAEEFVGEPKTIAPEEIDEWGWFPLDRLPEPLFPPCRNVLDCYLGNRFSRG